MHRFWFTSFRSNQCRWIVLQQTMNCIFQVIKYASFMLSFLGRRALLNRSLLEYCMPMCRVYIFLTTWMPCLSIMWSRFTGSSCSILKEYVGQSMEVIAIDSSKLLHIKFFLIRNSPGTYIMHAGKESLHQILKIMCSVSHTKLSRKIFFELQHVPIDEICCKSTSNTQPSLINFHCRSSDDLD